MSGTIVFGVLRFSDVVPAVIGLFGTVAVMGLMILMRGK